MTVVSSYEAQFKAEGVQEVKSGFAEIAKAAALADRQARVNTQNLKDYAKTQIQTEKEKARAMEMAAKEQAKSAAASDAMWKKVGAGAAVAAAAVVKFGLDSYKAYQQYAGSVRDVALASGASAEQSSIFLQVLDDFEISAADVTTALKAMTKNGMTPTIDTLAQLSDKYVAIEDPMKRNEFLLKNLGKAGIEWANALSQGGDALKAASDGINKNLILTDEQIKKAEQARLAVDAWADAWEGFKVSVGSAIGSMIVSNSETREMAASFHEVTGLVAQKAPEAFERYRAAMERAAAAEAHIARDDTVANLKDLGEAAEETAEKQKALEESSRQYMSVLKSISNETEQFTEKNQDLNDKLIELEDQLSKERKGSEKYKELQGDIEDTKTAITDLAAEHAKASKGIMFDLISQKAAAEGFKNISVEALATIGEQWGVLAEGSGDATTRMISQAEAWSEALSGVPGEIKSIAQMWEDLDKLAKKGIVLTASVVSQATGGAYGGTAQQANQGDGLNCFTGDTLILMADGSTKEIQFVNVGDEVISFDLLSREKIKSRVVHVFKHAPRDNDEILVINDMLKVTKEHPIWDGSDWKLADLFTTKDSFTSSDGKQIPVISIVKVINHEHTYNIEVDNKHHNYFANNILVHNKEVGASNNWRGGIVGSFAGGGNGGGWGIVGDKPGGGWVDGVSELVYGNFKVYSSKEAKAMLKSGMLGKVPGFAFGGNSDDFGGSTSGTVKKIPYVPTPVKRTKSSGGGGGSVSVPVPQAVMQQAAEMQVQTQAIANQSQTQVQTLISQFAATQAAAQSTFEEMVSVLRNENPKNVGKEVAYQLAKSS